MNPRRAAFDRVQRRYDVRILEPSPPAIDADPYHADDPINAPPLGAGLPILMPFPHDGPTWDELASVDADLARWTAARWLGARPALEAIPDPARYTATRIAWHTLAEHVVAPARFRATANIGLRSTHCGFGTPYFGDDTQVRVEGTEIVVTRGDDIERRTPITNLAEAASLVKITAGINHDLYRASTDGNPEAHLPVDPVAADRLGAWFGFANSVLEDVRFHSSPESEPGRVQLWPEHFDLGVDIGAPGAKGTFGASPGDEPHPEPYLYVTRWQDGPDGPFWNDTAFDGASLAYANLVAAPDARAAALTFFRTGFDQL